MSPLPNQKSDILKHQAPRIMQLWEARARDEIKASFHQDSLALQNSLSLYLSQLVDELSTQTEKTPASIEANKVENTRISKLHGKGRTGFVGYSMPQLILEYHILRQIIFQVLEEDCPLAPRERDLIIDFIEQAVNDAATEFSQTLQNIQESLAATLVHDFRGSLNVVKIGTQLTLRRLEQGDSHANIAVKMLSAVERLDSMVQNLLDASRLQAGHSLNFEIAECRLDILVRDVAEDLNFTYGDRFIVVCDTAVRSHCSRKEIRRVIENLATNAVKYGASNTPITLTLQQNETQISLTIHNEGNPIALDAQSILFQQFSRAPSAEAQKGWGLGLFLAKNIVEAHHGTIEVESGEGKGTSLIVRLPRADAD